jgi:FlaA1/EpsC-like NDP-sugar epimerase
MERLLQRQPISCPSDVKRFFVSPEESGEICLLTCILGNSGDIYFPKLNENQLVNFKSITEDFFKYLNKDIKICKSEKEAKEIALNLSDNTPYPIYFFKTDTSGEKLYEEFYTPNDEINLEKFESIGIIKNSHKPNYSEIESVVNQISELFSRESYNKEDVINVMSNLLPSFSHIETGKSLDQKM